MATSDWAIPTGKAITGATYIKDTDDNIAATIEDLVDWCNNTNGAYNDWTLTGLRTDFLSVSTAQAITSVKTIDTGGAIDFTNGQLRIGGVAVTSTAAELNILDGVTSTTAELNILDGVTSTTAELNILDGVTSTAAEINVLDGIPATLTATELGYVDGVTSSIQTQIDGKVSKSGDTLTGQLKGITPVSAEDLTRKDYVDSLVPVGGVTSGTNTPTATIVTNVSTVTPYEERYTKSGSIVFVSGAIDIKATAGSSTFTKLYLTLPVSSTFTSEFEASGILTARSPLQTETGEIVAIAADTRVSLEFNATTTNTTRFKYNYSYEVI